ncbi:MAG: FliG C-terminal domain-containing protein, partial [Chloroflexota bacterium]
ISWADEERDLTAWLGNEMQDEAYDLLYTLRDKVRNCTNPEIQRDWLFLQTSDHFYYMCTKWFSDGAVHKYFNPYSTPYEAFINYMNILSDFMIRVDEQCESTITSEAKARVTVTDVKGPGVDSKNTLDEPDFDIIFSLSKKDIKKALDEIDIKDLAYSLYDKADDKIKELKRKLPVSYKNELEKVFNELKKPRKTTIDNYRKKIAAKLQSYFNLF